MSLLVLQTEEAHLTTEVQDNQPGDIWDVMQAKQPCDATPVPLRSRGVHGHCTSALLKYLRADLSRYLGRLNRAYFLAGLSSMIDHGINW